MYRPIPRGQRHLGLNTVECARRGRLLSWPSPPSRFRGSIVCSTARRRGRCC